MFKDELIKALQSEKGKEYSEVILNALTDKYHREEKYSDVSPTCPEALGMRTYQKCDSKCDRDCEKCLRNATFEGGEKS